MARQFQRIPIVDAARRCGLVINDRTLGRTEVEASCPFCGDHGPGKYHLSLNTDMDVYRCNLCGAHGNSVTLYARVMNVANREAYADLSGGSHTYAWPTQPEPRNTERQPLALAERSAAYEEMLSFLTLSDHHRANLRGRGLSDERIEENCYKSMPETAADRRLLARLVRMDHDLLGVPGFYTRYGEWTLAGPNGFLIPVRDKDGLIQGLKIRLDGEDNPSRKYRWLSSRDKHLPNGTRSYSWVHVTGDRTRKRAYITEGPLKGDVASFLANDALFVCTGGVNATHGLRETLENLGVTEVVEAMDMDQMVNPQVRNGILAMRREVMKIPNLKYSKYTWNPAYKGVDDYFLSRVTAM
ncbi:MAG: hypothetical protein IJQ98_05310 [Oscillospiraceae bacterium]|nr:hypothetical protein [Oscillospiraceae bacterium]